MNELYKKKVAQCPLFAGLGEKEFEKALEFYNATTSVYKKGETVAAVSQTFSFFALVLDGAIGIYHDDENGARAVMAFVKRGQLFGESLCYLKKEAEVHAVALEDAVLLKLRAENLRLLPKTPLEFDLQRRFSENLATRALALNDRIQLLSKSTIREKVNAMLASFSKGKWITFPFDREGMAFYLGVDRSALSRELGKMQREGLIAFRKNAFMRL